MGQCSCWRICVTWVHVSTTKIKQLSLLGKSGFQVWEWVVEEEGMLCGLVMYWKRVQFFFQLGPFIYSWGKFIYLTLYFELRNWSSGFVILTVVGGDPEAHFPNQRSYFLFPPPPPTESLPGTPVFLGLSNPIRSPWILLSGSLQFPSFHRSPRTTCSNLWPIISMASFASDHFCLVC